jgi:rhamnosyltransferase
MREIAGVVVLYNPDDSILDNIHSYINDVDILYAVDNSDQKNNTLTQQLTENSKIHYIDNCGNQGIAHALNIAANQAIELGYQWLLTMDQDSHFASNILTKMLDYIQMRETSNISIIAPFHANKYHLVSPSYDLYSPVLTTMTSGNLLNLEVYTKIGGFIEDLFIDYVDNEYCLRSNLLGFKIIQINHAILNHNLGDLRRHQFLWKRFFSTNHGPLRRYYAFRNRFRIIEMYKTHFQDYCSFEKTRFIVDIIIILLYEREKCAKLRMMFRGFRDYKRGIFGKYHD